jgi:hypothetical protein
MANRYTIGSGVASNVAIWDGGSSVPVEGDRVLICAGHTVTLDGAYVLGDDATSTIVINGVSTTRSINIFGTIVCPRTSATSLTCKGNLYVAPSGKLDAGTYASPIPLPYTANIFLNYSAALADNKYGMLVDYGAYFSAYGVTKKRIATLTSVASAGATSIAVDDVTGWQVGDEVHLASTDLTTVSRYDNRFIASGYVSGDLSVPLTSALTYAHANHCPVGNVTSNVSVKPYNQSYRGYVGFLVNQTSVANSFEFGYCTFDNPGVLYPYYGLSILEYANYSATPHPNPIRFMESVCSIVRVSANPAYINLLALAPKTQINDCAFIAYVGSGTLYEQSDSVYSRCLISCTAAGITLNSYVGATFNDGWVMASNGPIGTGRGNRFNRTKFSGVTKRPVYQSTSPGSSGLIYDSCDFNETFSGGTGVFGWAQSIGTDLTATLTNCYFGALDGMTGQNNLTQTSLIKIINKDRDVTKQEEWYKLGTIRRDNATVNRSMSSMKMQASTASVPFARSLKINIANGETVRVIGYCKYDSTYYNGGTDFVAPTMTLGGTINGVDLTPVVYTAASANAGNWDMIDKSITNNTGAAGQITVTYSMQTAAVAGLVNWDGIVDSPMVDVARHYGFMLDDGNPKRVTNISISENETTAAAYTGMAVTGSTSAIAISASRTFQQLYDYTQAWSCSNLAYTVPITGSGISGSISMFPLGNITINDGYVLNGSGNLSIGTNTLSTEFAGGVNYTYTGGTWSQLTTVPAFGGGQVNLGAAGTYVFTATSSILSMTPAAASTYAMGGCTFTGTIDLRNTTAHAITVEVLSGTSTTTTNNTGGTITVSAPELYQSVTVSGAAAGSRIQIYDTTNLVELYNGTPSFPYIWTDSVAAVADRGIRLRVTNVSTVTAKVMIDANIGTCGTTEATAAISYLVAQTDDITYNTNAVDGSTVSNITIDDISNIVSIDIVGGGTIGWPSIYAYQVYWLNTATGIQDDFAFIDAPDTANYRLTSFQIRNVDAAPLILDSGYGVDATTGKYIDIIDTAGSTGNIFPDVSHVVPKIITVGGVNVITGDIADIPAAPSAASVASATVAANAVRIIDGAITVAEKERIEFAALAGKRQGLGTATEQYMAQDGTTPRITFVPDSNGNGTPTLNGG